MSRASSVALGAPFDLSAAASAGLATQFKDKLRSISESFLHPDRVRSFRWGRPLKSFATSLSASGRLERSS